MANPALKANDRSASGELNIVELIPASNTTEREIGEAMECDHPIDTDVVIESPQAEVQKLKLSKIIAAPKHPNGSATAELSERPNSDCVVLEISKPPIRKRSSLEGSPKLVEVAKKARPLPDLNAISDFLNPPPPLVPRHQSVEVQTSPVEEFGEDDLIVEEPSFIVPYLRHGKRPKTWKQMLEEENEQESPGTDAPVEQKSYFDEPIGSFLVNLGLSIAQEFVGEETLRVQRRKSDKAAEGVVPGMTEALDKLRNENSHLKSPNLKCKLCPFRSSLQTVIEHHNEVPHVRNPLLGLYGCNFCEFSSSSFPELHDHVRINHRQLIRVEKPEVKFECPLCPWEDKHKPRHRRHVEACEKKFDVVKNLVVEWDQAAKTPALNLKADSGKKGAVWKLHAVPYHMLVPKDHIKLANAFIASVSKPVKQGKPVALMPVGGSVPVPAPGEQHGVQPVPQSVVSMKPYEPKKKVRSIDISQGAIIAKQVAAVQQARALQQQRKAGRSPNLPNGEAVELTPRTSFSLVPSSRGPASKTSNFQSSSVTIRPVTNGKSKTTSVRSNSDPVPSSSSSSVFLPMASTSVGGRQQAVNLRLTLPPSLTIETVNGPIRNKPAPRSSSTPEPSSYQNGLLASSSVSITPVPQRKGNAASSASVSTSISTTKQVVAAPKGVGGVICSSFVVCEICDGYVKDKEQMWTHLQTVHKIKVHPRMMHSRPPLKCQKCQQRFYTDQGLERHLLGSHGLVTAHMQQNAENNRDAGRCPVCGKMLPGKLLEHVKNVHKMQVKPAQLAYKCTVCTEVFILYRDFEEHVFTLHTMQMKRKPAESDASLTDAESEPKKRKLDSSPDASPEIVPVNGKSSNLNGLLRIPEEITIIPQGRGEKKPSNSVQQRKERANDVNVLPAGIRFGSKEITVTRKHAPPALPPTDGGVSVANGRTLSRSVMPELKKL